MGRLLILVALGGVFWGLTAWPVQYFTGAAHTLVYSGTAMMLCLVPAAITLAWAQVAFRQNPEQQLMMALGGTGVRLFGVLIVALLLYRNVPLFRAEEGFLIWLVVCYLFTLAVEMLLLLKGRSRPDGSL